MKVGELPKQLLITSFLLDNVDIQREGEDRSWQARLLKPLCPLCPLCPLSVLLVSGLFGKYSAIDLWLFYFFSSRAYHNIPVHPDNSGTFSWLLRPHHSLTRKPPVLAADDEEEIQQVLDTPVWDFVMGSSSAPSFFPSFKKVRQAAPDLSSGLTLGGGGSSISTVEWWPTTLL